MSTNDVHELKLIFAIFDVDRSGSLTKDEVQQLLRTPSGPQITDEFVDEFMKIADADNSGDISVDEFVIAMTTKVPQGVYGLKDIFKVFDPSGDGFVEKEELEQAKKDNSELNQNLIDVFTKIFDQNSTDKISYEQFVDGVNEYYKSFNSQ